MDGSHRGFAFAEFLTHAEAEAARAALDKTHLYGRHLVLEYAEEAHSLEALRLKTARYLSQLQARPPSHPLQPRVDRDRVMAMMVCVDGGARDV